MAATAPLAAASPLSCPTTAEIDATFAQRRAEVAAYAGCAGGGTTTFTIWYDGPGGINGALQNSFINIRNQNSCTIDTTQYPLSFRIDVVNLTGSDTNTHQANCLERQLSTTNSYGYLSRPSARLTQTAGVKNNTYFEKLGSARVSGATRTVYSAYWVVNRAESVNAGEDIDIQFTWEDGASSGGRLTNTYRLVPLGFAAPAWESLTTRTPSECPDAYSYYQSKVQEWTVNGYGCSPNVRWEVATNVTTTSFRNTSGYTRTPIQCGTGMWSVDSKDFTPAHDGIY